LCAVTIKPGIFQHFEPSYKHVSAVKAARFLAIPKLKLPGILSIQIQTYKSEQWNKHANHEGFAAGLVSSFHATNRLHFQFRLRSISLHHQ
jgi:hypothetical protein